VVRTTYHESMTATRRCGQCGVTFTPRREHARFCSPECRVAWNRHHLRDAAAEDRALEWSVAGMRDVTERLSVDRPADEAAAFTAVAEAVWWVTIIDARLVRQYTDLYDDVLAEYVAVPPPVIEGTLAGLRFVRNMMSFQGARADFIRPSAGSDTDAGPDTDNGPDGASGPDGAFGRVAAWTWNRVPARALEPLPARVRPWETSRYQAYTAWLAERTVGEVFGRAAAFLNLAAAQAAPLAEAAAEAS